MEAYLPLKNIEIESTCKFGKNWHGFGERLERLEESRRGLYSFGIFEHHFRFGLSQIAGEDPG